MRIRNFTIAVLVLYLTMVLIDVYGKMEVTPRPTPSLKHGAALAIPITATLQTLEDGYGDCGYKQYHISALQDDPYCYAPDGEQAPVKIKNKDAREGRPIATEAASTEQPPANGNDQGQGDSDDEDHEHGGGDEEEEDDD